MEMLMFIRISLQEESNCSSLPVPGSLNWALGVAATTDAAILACICNSDEPTSQDTNLWMGR